MSTRPPPDGPQHGPQPGWMAPFRPLAGPAKVRGGGCSSADPGLRDHGIGPHFSARFARRIALFSYVFAAFWPQIPKFLSGALRAPDCFIFLSFYRFWAPNTPIFFRRASRAGLLHFPTVLPIWGPKYPQFPRRASRAGLLHFPRVLPLFGPQIP